MTSPSHEQHAAALHDSTRRVSHPDSEEAVQIERQRVAQELGPYERRESSRITSHEASRHDGPLLQTCRISNRSSTASNALLQSRGPLDIYATARPDAPRSQGSSVRERHWYSPIVEFWTTHVSLTIDGGAHRDHLALERTFLGYLRTSLILVMTGVITAQLFRIQRSAHPNPVIGFYVVGEPLSVAFIGMAIFVLLVGAIRFWRLQSALVRGKALAGGWEIAVIMAMSALLLVATFALVLAINIDKAK
ncbi:hypothetical protein C7974DRAFT_151644 [Boeremia exigua]|uniref:uncharacterized protein n=1 Tax=Boeremia exigua TaxID=749465 RepID=UPI001E8E75C4|nr:uncharacterized protein C7974DRAFT_151644 [Boeremia exigua]KAH6637972.1 hypothetical protein C7974DRAFT_151644 [Boeremia exigua]